jgi:hypothetical protein
MVLRVDFERLGISKETSGKPKNWTVSGFLGDDRLFPGTKDSRLLVFPDRR